MPAALAGVWAGSGGGAQATATSAALTLHVRLALNSGELSGPFLPDGRARARSGPTQQGAVPAGSLRLADLGYFALEVVRDLGAHHAYWLTRGAGGAPGV